MASEDHVKDVKESGLSSTTLFARNLPFTIDSKDLEKVFSDVGPVKRCFVVKDKENSGKCRGFGYVTFALKEDAAKAKESIKSINGRKVFITFSNKKPRHKQRGKPGEEIKNTENGDHIDTETIAKEIPVPPPGKHLESVQKSKHKPKSERSAASNDDGRTIVLSGFPSTVNVKQLKKACRKIGGVAQFIYPVENYEKPTAHAVFGSHKLARTAVRKLDGKTVKGSVLNAVLCSKENKKTVSVKTLKKSRLIVRNLPFKCSKEILMEEFSKFGDISEVVLPTKTVGKSKKKLGFAFVQFKTVFDAAKALEAMNQKEIKGRPIAVDWTLPKKKYELLKVSEDVEKGEDDQQLARDEDETSKKSEEHDSLAEEGPADQQETNGDHDEESEAEESVSGEESEENISDGESGAEESISDGEDRIEERKIKKKLRDAREGKTIFIRNLPFDASEEEICGLFEKFGKIAYCKIVVDHVTEHSRGSAFVKFEEKQCAEKCLNKCNMNDDHNEISLRNRPLTVSLAVTKGKVPRLLAEKDSTKKSPCDKRNLYLAKEGIILQGSQAAEDLSKADLQKRQKAEAEKKAKLKMPHYIVSKTRLCFRNLPLNVDNKKLTQVLRTACDGKPKNVGKVQIMRSNERFDRSGTGRSKGFGFVEFTTHEDALEILRATNNNPEIFGPDRRPIVEFAIENSLILKSQEQRKLRNQKRVGESQGQQQDKREYGDKRGQKRKWDRKVSQGGDNRDHQGSQGHTEGKQPKNPRKRQETGKAINAKTTQELNYRSKDRKSSKTFDSKIKEKSLTVNSLKNSKVWPLTTKDVSSSRPKHKQRERVNKEEENFNKIVEKYKSKLFGDNTKQLQASRWFQ